MTQVSVRIEGADKIRKGLNEFQRNAAGGVTKNVLRRFMELAQHMAVPYRGGNRYDVPARRYERTGNLGRSTTLIEKGLTFTIVSRAYRNGRAYSEYVIGKADGTGQAGVHVGWWTTLRDAVDAYMDKMLADLDAALQGEADKDLE